MRCVEFEMRLNDLLDERVLPGSDPILDSHVAECAECAELLSAHLALLDGAETLASWLPQSDLAVRVAAELRRQPCWLRRPCWHRRPRGDHGLGIGRLRRRPRLSWSRWVYGAGGPQRTRHFRAAKIT